MNFRSDCTLVDAVFPSPNHGERLLPVDLLLLHYTGMQDTEAAIARLCDPLSEVSAHYLVTEDGRILQLVPEARRAWHAGEACWAGEKDINSCAIGIEIANPGHDFGYPDFPEAQIARVIALCRDILTRRPIPASRVLAHSDVAPGRKQDPGEKFPWERLAEAGIGLFVKPEPIGDAIEGAERAAFRDDLAAFGYCVPEAENADVIRAFQRHFRPARVDGFADRSTALTLQNLLRALDGIHRNPHY